MRSGLKMGIKCLCSLVWSLASWDPCPVSYQLNLMFDFAITLAPAVAFRYSTESYLLLLRRVNSRLVQGTPPESTSILSISHQTKPSQLFGRVGKYPKDVGKNLCYVSYVEIYTLYSFHSKNITIST